MAGKEKGEEFKGKLGSRVKKIGEHARLLFSLPILWDVYSFVINEPPFPKHSALLCMYYEHGQFTSVLYCRV